MTNWDDEFNTQPAPPVAPPAPKLDMSDFDAADDFTAADFMPTEPERPEHDESKLSPPFSLDGIDLLSPPGVVGDVAAWIDSQCRYPRRRLAVASAIASVGNIGGLSHEDTRDGVTTNMLVFCVAASATGKEAIQQAMADLHRAVDLQRAVVGMIKSTKEILENLIEHQPSYFIIDEFGIFLQKVRNAQKRGGSAHLEEVNGIIMSAYSKANSYFILGGREKRELRKQYAMQAAKAQDDGDEDAHAIKMLKMIDNGLERPFLSIVGYTTPSTFDGVMDGESAEQGFIGRAIVVSEKDINPDMRKGFKKRDLPPGLKMRLMQLFHGGTFSIDEGDHGRIENYGDRTSVDTDDEANTMLEQAHDWFHRYANERMEDTGPASVAMARRSIELVLKISFILALAERVRTAEHVRWAFAYVRKELDEKIALVFANDNAKDKSLTTIAAKVQGMIDPEKGTSTSVMANKLKMSAEDVEKVLSQMKGAGLIYSEVSKRKYKGKPVVVWKMSEGA